MSGGSAVNAGIEYQQRVASWLLILFYRRDDLAEFFPGFASFFVDSMEFESDQPIDDIVLSAANGASISFQVKRTVSLSDSVDSELGRAFRQFVMAYGQDANSADPVKLYVLATSGLSSRAVTTLLRGILDKVRANPAKFEVARLSRAEKEVYETVSLLVDALNQELFQKPGDEILLGLLQRTHVTLLEVEPGTVLEKAAFTLLLASDFKSPALVWGLLVSTALTFAKVRASVGHPFLASTLEKYRTIDLNAPKPADIDVILGVSLVNPEDLPAGKDVVICSHPAGDAGKIAIMELFRFEDDGERRITYQGDKMVLSSGLKASVYARFGSMASAEKFIEPPNLEIFDGKDIEILGAEPGATAGVELAPVVKAHRAHLLGLLKTNAQLSNCLHCGLHIFKAKAYLVEIDTAGYPDAVGLVHANCRRPTDRIMGQPLNEPGPDVHQIPGFDYAKWAKLLMRGQAGLIGVSRAVQAGMEPVLGWNDEVRYYADYRYVLRLETADGDASYVSRRGRIERFNKPTALKGVAHFTEMFKKAAARGDPFAVNLDSPMFGPRSRVESIRQPDERTDLVTSVTMVEYSDVLGRIYNRFDNYYTPCCVVRDAETEVPFVLAGGLPLISRPLEIEAFIANWKAAGFKIGDYRLTIIENDMTFDQYMRQAFGDNLTPVYDPWIEQGRLPGGVQIRSLREMKAASEFSRSESQG